MPDTPDLPVADLASSERPLLLEQEMKDSYLSYAMSVIVSRALPDVRDGLKPSQRRILVAMNDLNLGPRSKQRKCAKIAGDTSGNYHPHGESVIYPTLVRMAQPFNMRYPLVQGQGNFGSIDGDPPAAMRYTEARMTAATAALMEDLELDTVDFVPNYEGTRQEPTVLPSRFPNLLVNGSNGIAVGMATSMPPHNLTEICQALVAVVDRPEITVEELMEVVKGPDFPTGGILCGTYGVREAYRTGRGYVVVRGKAVFEDAGAKGNRQRIVITEIPFQVNKTVLIEKIAELIKEGRLEGASEVRDESDKDGIRICVECRAGEDAKVVLNRLYEYTQLQDKFSIINIALVDGRPRTLSLKELLSEFVAYRRVVVTRRTRYLLGKALDRLHILEGFLVVLSHMDEVIATIRASADRDDAKKNLMAKFALSEKQADAIVDLRLHRLTALERDKIEQEHREVTAEVAGYRKILGDPKEVDRIVKEEVEKTAREFGDARRTDIGEPLDDTVPEDLIPDEEMTVTISRKGYVKRLSSGEYRAQRRGGKGIIGTDAQEDDFVEQVFIANNHDYLLLFTDTGRVHWLKVYQLPLLSRYSRGRAIANLLQLQGEEKITRVIPVRDFASGYLVMATRRGVIKRTELSAFSRPMRGGIIAIGLNEGDALVGVRVAREGDRVMLASREGQAICFELEDVRPMGRPATGVRGMNLRDEDAVVSLILAPPNATVLTVCANGFGKRTPLDEYRVQGRGGFGIINIKTTERNGAVVGVLDVTDDDDLLVATQQGQVVRTPVRDISTLGRNTQGVRLVRFKVESDQVASVGRLVHDEADGAASEAAEPPAGAPPATEPPPAS
ncbi:MAG: DNA gyrase subunit A [Planctomycetes bacterium]|nr:DNA gyrase subunit A [Planctomycetota bacterium]